MSSTYELEKPLVNRLYSDDAFNFSKKCPSYWEATATTDKESTRFNHQKTYDVAIIGGGYTGQSAALQLAKNENMDVAILEAGAVGWGASGRNGGFCIMGGCKVPYEKLIKKYGLLQAKQYFQAEKDAVQLVRNIALQENIDFDMTGQGEYLLTHKENQNKGLIIEQNLIEKNFGLETSVFSRQQMQQKRMKTANLHDALYTPIGFGLHPLKYTYGLFEACLKNAVSWFEHSPVAEWNKRKNLHILTTPKGDLKAKKVLIATNGYTAENLSPYLSGTLLPTMSNILVTRPLTEQERVKQGWTEYNLSFDSRNLLHYFRLLPDNRFLFGGRGGIDASDQSLAVMRSQLTDEFNHMFPEWRHVDIDYFWRGFVCLSSQLSPHISAISDDPSIFCALSYQGNGVAMGTWAGNQAANLIAERPHQIPQFMHCPPKSFPFPMLRKMYLAGAYLGYGIKDRLF